MKVHIRVKVYEEIKDIMSIPGAVYKPYNWKNKTGGSITLPGLSCIEWIDIKGITTPYLVTYV